MRESLRETSVNAFVNDRNHMARSSTEVVYAIVSGRTSEFLGLKWPSMQSRIVEEPVFFNLLGYLASKTSIQVVHVSVNCSV